MTGRASLSPEQESMISRVLGGSNVVVDAVVGAGKTTAIQELCNRAAPTCRILYLTYNRLLKLDAQARIRNANVKVQNYHGFVYPFLVRAGLGDCGISQSIAVFNANFARLAPMVPRYDMLVIDEYQDIREEMAVMLGHVRSLNPAMRIVAVGDMEQKIYDNTRLDVKRFITRFAAPCAMLSLTHTFRMGPDMGERLGLAWGKPIHGVNEGQTVRFMDTDQAYRRASELEPGQLMVLGPRNGALTKILNRLETERPETFNKNTVYASIRDSDKGVSNRGGTGRYARDTAIFTTFDSSKGLERDVCLVCGFDSRMWSIRLGYPDTDPVILRNKFLVAASRGKKEIVFVGSGRRPRGYWAHPVRLGYMPIASFHVSRDDSVHVYDAPFHPSDCFDFAYAEDVERAYGLLETRDGGVRGAEIEIDNRDGLIDLSPAIGEWQEGLFFSGYSAKTAVEDVMARNPRMKSMGEEVIRGLNGDPWHDALGLTALKTSQRRYLDQADDSRITKRLADRVSGRLAGLIDRDDPSQVPMGLSGRAVCEDGPSTPIAFRGLADAVHRGIVFELKFVGELTHEMALQLGLYLVMSGARSGMLWNVRTHEVQVVRVPDRQAFMDAVTATVTKDHYTRFEGSIPPVRGR